MKNTDAYSGADNLEVMKRAVNYNRTLINVITRKAEDSNKVLDFGAGNGQFANTLKFKNLHAVEIDDMLRAQINCETHKYLDETPNDFDLIYSLNVLEHIEDDMGVLQKLSNKLKPGGKLKIFVPARMEIFSEMDRKVGHYRRYHKNELCEKVRNTGLRVDTCTYFDSIGYLASFVYKWVDNSGDINPKSLVVYDRVVFPISRLFDWFGINYLIGKNLILEATKP